MNGFEVDNMPEIRQKNRRYGNWCRRAWVLRAGSTGSRRSDASVQGAGWQGCTAGWL